MRNLAAFALALTLMAPGALHAAESMTETRITIRAALQRGLDASLIEGAVQRIDLASGEVRSFYPVENHPMILELGDLYVLCSDLMGQDGDRVTVDYFFAPADGSYSVIRTEIGNRAPLEALMKAGKLTRHR